MKKIIFFLVFFSGLNLYSQGFYGEITYKQKLKSKVLTSKKIDKNSNEESKIIIESFNKSLKNNISKFSFILKFNEKESLFYAIINTNKNERNRSINVSRILSGANKIIYQNIETKEKLLVRDAYGEKFIVKSSIDSISWSLKNEEKTISGYKCYKAETFKITKNSRGIFKKLVTAWYSPSIPYNFGPKGYAGLPGMIIELTEGKFEYFVINLVLNKKEKIKIVKPSKGKLVTEEEFFQIGILASQSWGKN